MRVLRAKVVRRELPKYRHRWFGTVELDNGLILYMSGIASWFFKGDEVEVLLKNEPKDVHGKKVLLFDDYELYKIYNGEKIKVWEVFSKKIELPRLSFGKEVYRYRILAREAIYEKDFERIAELEQYHYASDEEMLALWHCERCDFYREGNVQPKCPRCGADMRFHDLKSATRASRFLVMELLDKAPYEPRYVGYVRVDPPVPLMNRRVPGGVEREIRDTLNDLPRVFDFTCGWVEGGDLSFLFDVDVVYFVGCGSSYYISITMAKYTSGRLGLETKAIPAGEMHFCLDENLGKSGLKRSAVLVSRSGESTEVILAGRKLKDLKIPILGVTIEENSSIFDVSDEVLVLPIEEESIVMTKSFTSIVLALQILVENESDDGRLKKLEESIRNVKNVVDRSYELVEGEDLTKYRRFVFLGAGVYEGIARESALKLQEMSQSTTEAFSNKTLFSPPFFNILLSYVAIFRIPAIPNLNGF